MIVDDNLICKIILKDIFNEDFSGVETIKKIVLDNTSRQGIEFILSILANPDYEILSKNDYFKVEYDEYINLENTLIDHLIDMGLFKDGYVYGKIVDSDSYTSYFESCRPSMKVNLFIHNEENPIKMVMHEATLKTQNLIKINKSDIKYFNNG
jgi:hypothetical protein